MKTLIPDEPLKQTIIQWLKEDIPSFDYGGYVVGDKMEHAVLYCKSPGVLAGIPFFDAVFQVLGCTVTWTKKEGEELLMDGIGSTDRIAVAEVHGPAYKLLQGERLALNILARCSGVATRARKMVKIKESKGWNGVVAGTRKTTPGFRDVEKYGMLVGGADTHRMDLSSMIMLKDNHIWSHGSITQTVKMAKSVGGFALKVEVECRSYAEAQEAIKAGADIVMLDNFDSKQGHECASKLKKEHPHVLIEMSGGLTEENIGAYMNESVDILSCGSLSQSVFHVDFSLKVVQK